MISNKGQNDHKFAPEVDNFSGAGNIKNMMVGPLLDLNGNVRGVIQLFNKLSFGNEDDCNGIVQHDKVELDSVCLALGEVIKTADQYYDFEKQCNHLHGNLHDISESIDNRIQAEYGKKGQPSSEMFKLVRSVRTIE